CIASQAAGARAHASSTPFLDPSGVRLRDWMGIGHGEFYDASRIAIVPMGFCFPGYDDKGADIPPRRECAPEWRETVFKALPNLQLLLLIGLAAQSWHLGKRGHRSLTANVTHWQDFRRCVRDPGGRIIDIDPPAQASPTLEVIPTPHPSWRNNAWLARHSFFEADVLPHLRARVRSLLDADGPA
ncbi:MAG: uracil-DNA glycosylase family protein, partial [Pseudomonadota bacterium]